MNEPNIPAVATTSQLCCRICNLNFLKKEEVGNHKLEAHPQLYFCSTCGLHFQEMNALRKHVDELHSLPKDVCLPPQASLSPVRSSTDNSAFFNNEARPRLYHCSTCGLDFKKKKVLRKHVDKLHSLSENVCPPLQAPLSPVHCSTDDSNFVKEEVCPQQHRCSACGLDFKKKKALRKHLDKPHPLLGEVCKPSKAALPPVRCHICDFASSEKEVLRKHKSESHPQCKHCTSKFLGLEELRSHQQETSHLYCPECDIYFLENDNHVTHVRNLQHATQYHCCDCDREYGTQELLANHCCNCDIVLRSQKKAARHPAKCPNLPQKCETGNEKRKPSRHIPCPAGGKCSKKFATPSALLNHLESGCCRSGMTRATMAELVIANDTNRYITSTDTAYSPAQESTSPIPTLVAASLHNLLREEFTPVSPNTKDEDTASEWSVMDARALLTPTTSEDIADWSFVGGVPLTPDISNDTSEWSFTGANPMATPSDISTSNIIVTTDFGLRCSLCPLHRKTFGSARALQAHVASAAHAPKIFHCPISFLRHIKPEDVMKRRSFSTLAGLAQHMESGKCEGGAEVYRKAIQFVEEQLDRLGLSGIRLLSD